MFVMLGLFTPVAPVIGQDARQGELQTLFTTSAERRLIDSNRYRSETESGQAAVNEEKVEAPLRQLVQKEFTREYRVSGITISPSGTYTVWINGEFYEDGITLEDGSTVDVIKNNEPRVRIIAPDGKTYYVAGGETLEITYLAAVDEHDADFSSGN